MEPTDSEAIDTISDGYATGDVTDDDGQAIDSYFEAPDTRLDTRTVQSVAVPVETLPVPQRIITSTGFIGPGETAMVLNADVKRKGYQILTHTVGASRNFYLVASHPDTFMQVMAAQISTGTQDKYGFKSEESTDRPIEPAFIPYNGPLYIRANDENLSAIYYIVTAYTE
jgi:hypothetical protein